MRTELAFSFFATPRRIFDPQPPMLHQTLTPTPHSKVRHAGHHHDRDVAHDEDGSLIPVCSPDYDAIDRNVFHVSQQQDDQAFNATEIDAACAVIVRVVEWLWSDGMKNCDGLQNRAVILCWVFLSQLRPLTMTEMARGFGKKKQSLGRAVDDFKTAFPRIRISHMKD